VIERERRTEKEKEAGNKIEDRNGSIYVYGVLGRKAKSKKMKCLQGSK